MNDIAKLLRAAEIKHTQLELELQFKKNMALLKAKVPKLYEQFSDYKPEELRLAFSEEGYVNLVNFKLDNKPVYSMDPKEFAKIQVQTYLKRPSISRIGILDNKPAQVDRFFQAKILNNLTATFRESIDVPKDVVDCPMGFMIMTGVGLGYHLADLIEQSDIYSLCIFDPHPDSFYASLHTIDWAPVIDYFMQPHKRLKFFIGVNERDALHQIRGLASHIGIFNLSVTWLYRHFNSAEENRFLDLYCKEFHFNAAGMGFLEDEQVSLAHTTHNLNNRIPVLKKATETTPVLPPLIIVGNGPSLDDNLERLRALKDKAIIFSCGSTSGTLCKAGIVPDFHIEMERTRTTYPWLIRGTTESFRNDVTLLALNTVAPDTFSIFPKALMAMKSNDPGLTLLSDNDANALSVLNFCNPTVTNCGLAFAIELGFKDIYLMGVDLGWQPEGEHHSKLSLYNEFEGQHREETNKAYEDNTYQVKGNFSDLIVTNNTLDDSRSVMELLLKYSNVDVKNTSNGLFIQGTTPYPPENLVLDNMAQSKQDVMDYLTEHRFTHPSWNTLSKESFKKDYLSSFFTLKEKITLNRKLKTKKDIFLHFNDVYKKVEQLKADKTGAKLLLKGSLNSFFMCIIRSCLFERDQKKATDHYHASSRYFNDFINRAFQLMENDPLKLDPTQEAWEKETADIKRSKS